MNDMVLIMLSYTAIIFISFGILAFLQAGFLGPFLKVKTSRGKKILVRIRKPTGSDYLAAKEIDGMLVFTYHKEKKRVGKYKNGLYRSFNINCVDIDGETWGVVTTSFESVSTNDPAKTDSLIERALLRPDKKTTKEIIMLLLLLAILIGIFFIGYKLVFVQNLLTTMQSVGGVNL